MNKFTQLVEDWEDKFGLANWKIRIAFDKDLKQYAQTVADPRYQTATITFNSRVLTDEVNWHTVIIHELIHIVMSMYDFYVDNKVEDSDIIVVARENAVSQLGEIFLRNMS